MATIDSLTLSIYERADALKLILERREERRKRKTYQELKEKEPREPKTPRQKKAKRPKKGKASPAALQKPFLEQLLREQKARLEAERKKSSS